jgi:hypothetical protein
MDREGVTFLGWLLGAVTVLIVVILVIIYWASSISCKQQANLIGAEYHYSLFTDCYIRVEGRWEPLHWQRSVRIKEK